MPQSDQNKKVVQQQGLRKVKGVADVVFVLDRSGSMAPCIQAVKDYISDFIDALSSSNQQISSVDWRIGFVAFDSYDFYILNFEKDVNKFKGALKSFKTKGNELTLPAVDVALDFNWRDEAQRIVIIFTDEPLEGGVEIPLQLSKFQDLLAKIVNLNIKIHYFGVECPYYSEFKKLPGSNIQFVDLHSVKLSTADFGKALVQMGKTLSQNLTQRVVKMKNVKKDLYAANDLVKMHYL